MKHYFRHINPKLRYTVVDCKEEYLFEINSVLKLAALSLIHLHQITYLSGRYFKTKLLEALSDMPEFEINHAYLGVIESRQQSTALTIKALGANYHDCITLYDDDSYEYKMLKWFENYYKALRTHDCKHYNIELYKLRYSYYGFTGYIELTNFVHLDTTNRNLIMDKFENKSDCVAFLCTINNPSIREDLHFLFATSANHLEFNFYKCWRITEHILSISKSPTDDHIALHYWGIKETESMLQYMNDRTIIIPKSFGLIGYLMKMLHKDSDEFGILIPNEIICMIKSFAIEFALRDHQHRPQISIDQASIIIDNTWVRAIDLQISRLSHQQQLQ